MVRWAFGVLFLFSALAFVYSVDARPIMCVHTIDESYCETDGPTPPFEVAISCDYAEMCCTHNSITWCWQSFEGGNGGTDWATRIGTDAGKMCAPNTCNDGNSCIPKGIVIGSIPGDTVCTATGVRCGIPRVDFQRPTESDGGGAEYSGDDCEAQVQCTTLPPTTFSTQWLCERSASDTAPNPFNTPALYKCDGTKQGQTFTAQGSGSQYCCSQNPTSGAHEFIDGACAPTTCPAGQHKELRRGTDWGQNWGNRPSFGPQNVCAPTNTCIAGSKVYNSGTTWMGGSGNWGSSGESWVCGVSAQTSGGGSPAFYRCGNWHIDKTFTDTLTGTSFCCAADGVFRPGACSGAPEVRLGANSGKSWDTVQTITSGVTYSCPAGNAEILCNNGVTTCHANGMIDAPGGIVGGSSDGMRDWVCGVAAGAVRQEDGEFAEEAALFVCDSTHKGDIFRMGGIVSSEYCCREISVGRYEFTANLSMCNAVPGTSPKRYTGNNLLAASGNGSSADGTHWYSKKNQGNATGLTCNTETTQCAFNSECLNVGDKRPAGTAGPSGFEWICEDTGLGPAMYLCSGALSEHAGKKLVAAGREYCCSGGRLLNGDDPACAGSGGPTCAAGDGCRLGCTPADPDCSAGCPSYCGRTYTSCLGTQVQRCTYSACSAGTCEASCSTFSCGSNLVCSGGGNCVCPAGTTWSGGTCAESVCNNARDDDANAEADYDGAGTGLHGDRQCAVAITAASAPASVSTVAACSTRIKVTCSANPGGVTSVAARLGGQNCAPSGGAWYDGDADGAADEYDFFCDVPSVDGTLRATCSVDTGISYMSGTERSADVVIDCRKPVVGTVTQMPSGAGIADAKVRITGTGQQATTNVNGQYTIPEVALGAHNFTAEAEGFYSGRVGNRVVDEDPETVSFTLDPWQCTENCTFGTRDRCDYTCLGDGGCALDVPTGDQDRLKAICNGAMRGAQRDFNSTHIVDCCTGPIVPIEEYEAPLTIQSCADQLIPHTTLVNYNGKIHRLTVVTYKKCGQ